MVTQKAISLKIDTELLEELDAECANGFRKRNWHINRAIHVYLALLDSRRLYKCTDDKDGVFNRFLRQYYPEYDAAWQ